MSPADSEPPPPATRGAHVDRGEPTSGRLVQALFGVMFVAWIAVAAVSALSLNGAAAGVVTVAIVVAGAAIGWLLRRRALARAAERVVPG